jgi:hypothetical protein
MACRVISTIQFVADIIFTLGFVACLDYLASMFNCSYMEMTAAKHYIFQDVSESSWLALLACSCMQTAS